MILVDAIYTNHSGSMRLLEYFVRYVNKNGLLSEYFFFFDRRLKSEVISLIDRKKYVVLDPSESARKVQYLGLPDEIKSVFCFGSVPPPVKVKDRPITILQHNPFFFETPGYSLRLKMLYLVKRLYIKSRCYQDYKWIVQTLRMKEILIKVLGVKDEKISVKPFFELDPLLLQKRDGATKSFSFIYPADGVPQKNHILLFRVWQYLRENFGLLPELHLTVPAKFPLLLAEIERLKQGGLKIFNHGFVSHAAMKELYLQHKFLLFPSLSESFGLPLVEAASAGLNVIGSDLPYIYQVIKPSVVFDPHDVKGLSDVIVNLSKGINIPATEVLVKDNIAEVVQMIHVSDSYPRNVK